MDSNIITTGDVFTYNEMKILQEDFIDPVDTPKKSIEQIDKKIEEYEENLALLKQAKNKLKDTYGNKAKV